jgi:predicted kinase
MEVVIFMGIQGSGKSTFYKQRFFRTHIRINLDMLKTRYREKSLVEACLHAKQSFVIDNTNPTAEDRLRYIPIAKQHDFEVIGYFFSPDVEGAIERNQARDKSEQVPLVAIKSTSNRLEPPSYREGFDQLYQVTLRDNHFFAEDFLSKSSKN